MFDEGENQDPVAIEINVDAALLLQHLTGIDSYPSVLALLPNVFRIDDRDRVRAVVTEQLAEAGAVVDGRVHPVIEQWLHCLYRPDVELAARIVSTGLDGAPKGMLRLSLVRSGERHVLAVRSDDHVVIQSVFDSGRRLDTLAAVLAAALGPAEALRFEPFAAWSEEFDEMSGEPDERRRALVEFGAQPRTAGMLSRVLDEVVRRAEIVMIEHRDGATNQPEACVNVLDTTSGRIIVTPSMALDGGIRATCAPGDDTALRAGVAALVDLLPGRDWFETSRVD
ncbi:EspG family protein [Nocardia nova SH22a]|uniref:EspG family protein n=1 Tax=Nocardia nova SH22a TaxID=1415166 RepID=W5TBU0_9NOCA|nr:ESX secretion-associated protein EspG [Nocardia nova]AHH16418.1 EspG family protein [Nocardia nova SH22a]